MKSIVYTGVLILSAISILSCSKIKNESVITVRNTFQSEAFTGGAELTIEELFEVPEKSLEATSTFDKDDMEFTAYLLGLYDINFTKNTIEFRLAAEAGDDTYGDLFRTIEAGTFDRYYFTFDKGHKIKNGESNNSSVNFSVISDNELMVEITEGYDFNPGIQFTIDLK